MHTQACNETIWMHIVAASKSINNIRNYFSLLKVISSIYMWQEEEEEEEMHLTFF